MLILEIEIGESIFWKWKTKLKEKQCGDSVKKWIDEYVLIK